MTAIRPERPNVEKLGADKSGPEKFAPVRPVPDKLGEIDQAAANAFEGEIREFVRRDVAFRTPATQRGGNRRRSGRR